MFTEYINKGVEIINVYANSYLIPLMLVIFVVAIVIRLIVYITIKSENAFASEFEKRVHKYLGDPNYEERTDNFHALVKTLLKRTYEEYYNIKRKFRRRRFDQITCLSERIFLVPEGTERIISDTLSQTVYLRKDGRPPNFLEISKWVFESNPVFNRVLGIFPMGVSNDMLNILPGLFVIGGIFGTFVGVMQALPMLSEMDITKVDTTKAIMDAFLIKMAFSMGTSIVGIIFSVAMTVTNAIMNPETIYYSMVTKFTSSLEFLWNDTTMNYSTQNMEVKDRRAVLFSNAVSNTSSNTEVSSTAECTKKLVEDFKEKFNDIAPNDSPKESNVEEELYVGEIESLGVDPEEFSKASSEIDESVNETSNESKLAVLKHRLDVLDLYLNEFENKYKNGEMNEEMLKEEREKTLAEKEKIQNEIAELEIKTQKVA